MREEKILSKKTRTTDTHEVTTTRIETSCYCCKDKDPQNCPCFAKPNAWPRDSKRKDYGPCIICKGTRIHRYSRVHKSVISPVVGGPLDGQKVVAAGEDYEFFNRAGRDKGVPKTIWVFRQNLGGHVECKKHSGRLSLDF